MSSYVAIKKFLTKYHICKQLAQNGWNLDRKQKCLPEHRIDYSVKNLMYCTKMFAISALSETAHTL